MSEKRAIINDTASNKLDIEARKTLKAQEMPIQEWLKMPEYRKQVEDLLADLDKGFKVKEANLFEADEYCIILQDPNTNAEKSYAFEVPLPLNLPPEEKGQAERTEMLKASLQEWIS